MVPALEVKLRLVHVSVSEPFAPLFGSTFPVTVWTSPTRKSAGHDDDCTVKGSELQLKLGVARSRESMIVNFQVALGRTRGLAVRSLGGRGVAEDREDARSDALAS